MSDTTAKTETAPARLLRFDRHPRVTEGASDLWCCFAFQDAMRQVEDEVYNDVPAPRLTGETSGRTSGAPRRLSA